MRNNLFKFIFASFFIMSSAIMFAQGTDDGTGTLEDDDPPAAPINTKIFILVLVGIIFAVYTIKNDKKLN